MKNLIIITGTSQGLGREFESILSSQNNYIISINRNRINRDNENIYDLCMDLSKITDENILKLRKVIDGIENQVEKFIFINNAFTINPLSTITNLDKDELSNSFNINIISSILLLKEFIKSNKNSKKIIINISSGAAFYAIKDWSVYCTTKAAVEMFLKCINKEYPEIIIHSVDPGVMDTSMQKEIREKCLDNNYFRKLKEDNSLLEPRSVALKILQDMNLWN